MRSGSLLLAIVTGLALAYGCQAYDRAAYQRALDAAPDIATGDALDRADGPTPDTLIAPDGNPDIANDASCAACAPTERCCGGTCVDVTLSPTHCGACNSACPGTTCSGGSCTAVCRIGFLDCDNNVVNGCEIDAANDGMNCGACGRVCPTGRSCNAGVCECAAGTADCDGNVSNGCEADLQADRTHCGGCSTTCATGESCVSGRCECSAGFADCDGNAANGCEADTGNDPAHCGACGTSCGTNGTCTGGACGCTPGLLRCPAGSPDCSTNILDPMHCGDCATACPASAPLCTSTGCQLSCASGQMNCGGMCADLATDPAHCGACTNACTTGPNTVASCTAGACASACRAGFGDCDGDGSNGCEVDLRTTATNCGACGRTCGTSQSCVAGVCACDAGLRDCGGRCAACCTAADCNDGSACTPDTCTASGTCTHGTCAAGTVCCGGLSCNACCSDADCTTAGGNRGCGPDGTCSVCASGFRDCDGSSANGCETDVRSSLTNCGGCGTACSFANAAAVCSSGVCTLGACNAGYANCDGNASNGCETALTSSTVNCGTCGHACSTGQVCSGGMCVAPMCPAGMGDCDGSTANGCETDLRTSATNCGSCGTRCTYANGTGTCTSGMCAFSSCNTGFGNCDANLTNGCEANFASSVTNCGACGNACSYANASASCAAGTCSLGACTAGFGNCDAMAANGCERALNTVSNCGGCNVACPTRANSTPTCTSGICGFTCSAGWGNCDGDPTNGCETDVTSNASNCGACGAACSSSSGTTPTCTGGVCSSSCLADYGDCDNSTGNGCETPLTSTSNCGACGRVCPTVPGALSICQGGSCTFYCPAFTGTGSGNCDGDPANGCELSTCTSCNGSCPSGPNSAPGCNVWSSSTCTLSCTAPYLNCDGNPWTGCEVNGDTDGNNCGACGTVCATGRVCSGGGCRANCPSGLTACGTSCADLSTDRRNCGMCGHACTDSQVCTSGVCFPGSACTTGLTMCAGVCANLQTNQRNCGACGRTCAATETCQSGVCAASNADCANARFINLTGIATTVSGTTVHGGDSSGGCTTGPDVFYRFTLVRREFVYIDTFGSDPAADTVIGIATACGAAPQCVDNSCGTTRSQWSGALDPGTYYVVIETVTEGPITFTVQHIPVAGTGTALASGPFTLMGTTVGATHSPDSCGAGPDRYYYWSTCPTDAGGTLTASTCTGASFDTVVQLRNGSGTGGGCIDNTCGTQSALQATVPAGSGLHVLFVDGASASASGAFTLRGSRP